MASLFSFRFLRLPSFDKSIRLCTRKWEYPSTSVLGSSSLTIKSWHVQKIYIYDLELNWKTVVVLATFTGPAALPRSVHIYSLRVAISVFAWSLKHKAINHSIIKLTIFCSSLVWLFCQHMYHLVPFLAFMYYVKYSQSTCSKIGWETDTLSSYSNWFPVQIHLPFLIMATLGISMKWKWITQNYLVKIWNDFIVNFYHILI